MKKFLFTFFAIVIVAGANAQKPEAVALKSTVIVDGVLDEPVWQQAVKYKIDSVYKNESIEDSADCSGFFQVAWNEHGIYVAVTVTDDSTNVTGPQGPDWAWDMVEIYFDMNIGKLEDGRGTQEGMGHYQVAGHAKDGINGWRESSYFAYKTDGSNYIKEAFASWTDLADSAGFVQNPVNSIMDTLAIGLDVYIVDNDRDSTASGRNFRDRLVWTNWGEVTETWDNADDAGILKFDTTSVAGVDNEYVTVSKKIKGLPLNIDGVLDENVWATAPKYKIAQVYKGEEIAGGADDCSGYFQTLWTNEGIYVGVTVTDDSTNVTGPQGPDWARDMVEIYFDMNVGKLKDGRGTQEGMGHYQVAGLAKDGINTWGAGSKFAYKTDGSNYVKETFVKWTDLKDSAGVVQTPVDAIGFDVYIVDNDRDSTASGRNFRDRLVWANWGEVTETWDNADDGGIMKFNMAAAIENSAMLTINKVTGDTIIADGKLDESIWDSLPKIQIDQVYKGEKITGGAADCSGYFQIAWNDNGIYVAVNVTDDSTNVTGPQGPDWAQDMVEIYFDMNVGNLDDGLGTQESQGHYQVAGLAKDGINSWGAGSKFAYLTDGSNYVKEAFVRWADLKNVDGDTIAPKNNMQLGFDVYIVDNDRDSTASGRNFRDRLVWANWGDITETWDNADDAGIIKLSTNEIENVYDYVPPVFISDIQSVGSAVVYPNPVKDILNIGNVSEKVVVSIFSIEGKKLMQSKEGATSINISSLQNGIYLVRISDQNMETIKRIIVQ